MDRLTDYNRKKPDFSKVYIKEIDDLRTKLSQQSLKKVKNWHSVEIKPEIRKGSSKFYFDKFMWKSMFDLSDNIEKSGPAHAILRG